MGTGRANSPFLEYKCLYRWKGNLAILALWAMFLGFCLINTDGKRRKRIMNFAIAKMLVPQNSDPQGSLPRRGESADRRSMWGRPGTIQSAVRESRHVIWDA